MTERPPFNAMIADTSGRIKVDRSPERLVLNLTDLSTIAAVHALRVMVRPLLNLITDQSMTRYETTGWDVEWKPATPEKPWGVFA